MASESLLQYSKDVRIQLLRNYGRTPESVKDDILSIKEWAKKQSHFPEIPNDERIEGFLFMSKFIFAKTKSKLNMYYSFRRLMPEFYKDPYSSEMVDIAKLMYFIPLPKLTPDNTRVIINKLRLADNSNNINPEAFFSHIINISEILLVEDSASPKIYFGDCENILLNHIKLFSPMTIIKARKIFEKVYTNKLEGIHLLNVPTILESLLSLMKSLINPKIAQKMYIHKSTESLWKYVPKEILPQDYGGEEKSLEMLHELWVQKIHNLSPMLQERNLLQTHENISMRDSLDSEILGCEGNFRKLSLD